MASDVAAKLAELYALDPRQHWFCGRVDGGEAPLEARSGLDALVKSCFQLFAYTDPESDAHKERLAAAVDEQLGKCDLCIPAYYRLRATFLEGLRIDYEDDDVELLSNILHEYELHRIQRGLSAAAKALGAAPSVQRNLQTLTRRQRHAIVEALTCEKFLLDRERVSVDLLPVFGALEDRNDLFSAQYLPAMAAFLFISEPTLCEWAHRMLARIRGPMTRSDFDFAFRGALERTLMKAATPPYDPGLTRMLWSGLRSILRHLDSHMITHSLRSLEVDIYKLALEHLQLDDETLCYILQTITELLITSPKDLWDAMGAISPTTVAEQIFRSPRFGHVLLDARPGDADDPESPLADTLAWIRPFMDSLQIGNQPPVARSITDQLLARVRSNGLSAEARMACWREATRLLAQVLAGCNESTSLSDAVGRAVATDALAYGNAYMADVVDILEQPREDAQARTLAGNCIVIVHAALALECKIIYTDRTAIVNGKHMTEASSIHAPSTWQSIVKRLGQDNVSLARAILGGSSDLVYLERIPNEKPSPKEEAVNRHLNDLFGCVGRALERMNYFSARCLREMVQYPSTNSHLLATALCGEQSVHDSAVELMKSATAESFRRDAIRSLLMPSLREPIDALTKAIQLVVYLRSFDPCTHLLRICGDVTFSLTDPQDGILLSGTTPNEATMDALNGFWEYHWKALKMMSERSEHWNVNKVADRSVLREFVRDVMQSAESLFDQFNVINNVLARNRESLTRSGSEEVGTQELLHHPAEATEGIMRYLRLKDEYLLRTSVQLIRKLLAVLTQHAMELPPKTTNFLTEVCIFHDASEKAKRFGVKTLLFPTEIAGLTQDLESNAGADIVQQARDQALIARGMIPDDDPEPSSMAPSERVSSQLVERPSPFQQVQKKRQGTIDVDRWTVRAESTKDVERIRIPDSTKPAVRKDAQPPAPSTGLSSRLGLGKPAQLKPQADQAAFLNKRKLEKLEQERLKADAAAKLKKGIPGLISQQTANAGSALTGIGVKNKDAAPKQEPMMLSSDSESSSDDEFDKDLFGPAKTKPVRKPIDGLPLHTAPKPRGPVKKMRIQRSAKDMRARLAPQMTGLYAKLLSWDFFHEGDFPPGSSRADFSAVKDSFRTAAEYRSSFESLLLLEAWSSFCKAREETTFRPFEFKVANRISVDLLFEVSVTMDAALCKEIGVLEGDILVLSNHPKPQESPKAPHCLGRVSKSRFKKAVAEVTLQVASGPSVHPWITQGSSLHAVKLESIITLEREYAALCGLEWYDLCHEIVRGEISPILAYQERAMQSLMNNYRLNLAQAKAVQSAIDNDAFTLIQGPPGSGKTKTIVAIVGALLTETLNAPQAVTIARPGQQQSQENVKKLLVCAPSNAAVDELVMRFMQGVKTKDGRFYKPNVLRLGRSDRVNPQVLSVTLDEKIEKILNPLGEKAAKEESELEKAINAHKAAVAEFDSLRTLAEEARAKGTEITREQERRFEVLKRQRQSWGNEIERLREAGKNSGRDVDIKRRQAEQKVVNDSQIICATLSGSARESFQALTVDFESVVIDEAAQCIELSALIPLKYGCAKCIMVGDPKQLPPTVFSREAARFQYEQSLFVRMQRNSPGDVHLLDTQYRMHPAISRFPSRVFYDDRLLDGPDMAVLRAQAWHQDPLLGPYRFYDVAGRHQNAPRGHSLINTAEVEVALELYKRLTGSVRNFDFSGKIGIITPYKSQLRLLADRFTAKHGPDISKKVEFNTTDAFQGRESEIIIFSCVRASDRGIGFLADIRRMNVGITRAKCSLWVLGNSQSLMQGEFWNKLVTDAKERGLFTHGNVTRTIRDTPRVHVDAKSSAWKPSIAKESSPSPAPEVIPPAPEETASVKLDFSSDDMDLGNVPYDSDEDHLGNDKSKKSTIHNAPQAKGSDIDMPDAPPHLAAPRDESGTSTPKRKRSDSPPAVKKEGGGTEKFPRSLATVRAPLGGSLREASQKDSAREASARASAPAPPRPRKPKGEDALFIKPKRKK